MSCSLLRPSRLLPAAGVALLLVALACSSSGHGKPRPGIDPNPKGSPWGPPTDLNVSHAVVTDVGTFPVYTRGYPVIGQGTEEGCAPSSEACIDLDRIADVINATARQCAHPFPGVRIYIQWGLLRCGGGYAAGCFRSGRVELTNYYVAWDGRIAHYLAPLGHELKHAWGCSGVER